MNESGSLATMILKSAGVYSDEAVARIAGINMLAAKGPGSARLTATASNGKKAVVEVRVSAE